MMTSFPGLTKFKTKQTVYPDVLAVDPGTLEQMKELSSKRKAIEVSICGDNNITEAIAREMSGGLTSLPEQGIQKLEHYLPLLENLVHHIARDSRWNKHLKIRWSSVLISSSVFQRRCQKFYEVNFIHFELAMTLFLYGAMLRERALEISNSDLVQSATLYRKAAGVYEYLAKEVVICLDKRLEKPPEATSSVCSIMSLICLADAQAVAARKAEEDGKSNGLLAKLHYGITEFLAEAIDKILPVAIKDCKDITSRLQDFLVSSKTLHQLRSYKHFVISQKNDGKFGVAIGLLQKAITEAKKSVPKEECWRLIYKQVIDDLNELLRKCQHENDFIWHEKVPSKYELPPLPEWVKIVKPIPYQPQKCETTLHFKFS